MGINSFISL